MNDCNDECYCKDCIWNLNGNECLIPEDPHVTLGEDCPYLEDGGQ